MPPDNPFTHGSCSYYLFQEATRKKPKSPCPPCCQNVMRTLSYFSPGLLAMQRVILAQAIREAQECESCANRPTH